METRVAIQAVGSFQRGDIISVHPDGHRWGRRETQAAWLAAGQTIATWEPTGCAVVKFVGEPVDLNLTDSLLVPDETAGTARGGVRSWFLDVDSLPNNLERQLTDGAIVELPLNRITAIKNRATLQSKPTRLSDLTQQQQRFSDTSERARLGR